MLQYAGIAGELPAYGDRFKANPSLVYARTREPDTRMKSRREGRTTTYEWAIQVYDRFPDVRTRLEPRTADRARGGRCGQGLGPIQAGVPDLGRAAEVFKGFDAESLGELYLAE